MKDRARRTRRGEARQEGVRVEERKREEGAEVESEVVDYIKR